MKLLQRSKRRRGKEGDGGEGGEVTGAAMFFFLPPLSRLVDAFRSAARVSPCGFRNFYRQVVISNGGNEIWLQTQPHSSQNLKPPFKVSTTVIRGTKTKYSVFANNFGLPSNMMHTWPGRPEGFPVNFRLNN